ncbi:hypothetical protein NQ314_009861 [Rhamnusium bicolor]|uniref:HTH psq-type domain-containing protein n=1 Tax=Rhamnusium bicolor TaxID=1586634 RepID=A0AAV8XYR7_9CUCU|nr:hypothetical protein NQ314_009861 [Rhamnusium bicolor]
MPRSKKDDEIRRKYKSYNEESMKNTVSQVKNGTLSVKRAAEIYGINRSTLINHLKNYKCKAVDHPTVLTLQEEKLLVNSLIKLAEWGFGLDRFKLRIAWIKSFENRWKKEIRNRVAQNLPKNRAEACSLETLNDFYEKFKNAIEGLDLSNKPQNIFNCDESGFQTDAGIQKILCRKGSNIPHKLGNVTKATYTALVCCSAIGEYLPLFVNYKGQHLYAT